MGRAPAAGSAGLTHVSRRVRRPAVAGVFYPADAESLAATVDGLLLAAAADRPPTRPAAMVVPHAGYRYSGAVAATAYARLGGNGGARRFLLLGPAHFVRLNGLAAPAADAWRTPLGEVAIDGAARDLAGLPVDDGPHAREHALEVQLPFLQRLIGAPLTILPIAVGWCAPVMVAEAVDRLAGRDMVVLVSTDLSHYHDDPTTRRRDARTAAAILARDPAAIRDDDACGAHALRGLLTWAARHAADVHQLALRTSAEASGDPSRVVGYGAFELTR